MEEEKKVGEMISICRQLIAEDGAKEVQHFYDQGEFEMAFEGLVLELISADVAPSDISYGEWIALGKALKLDEESIFVGDFWDKFLNWTNLHMGSDSGSDKGFKG